MIILSIITVKDKTVETTDVVNIENGADLHNPEVVKEIVSNRFGIKKESLTRYRARIQRGDKWESLGTYDTPEEAFYAYKPVKEAHIKSLAEKWKDKIDPRVYESLMNWTIEITD